jgi:hypothetical protein
VLKCHHRTFTQQEWTGLAAQLAALNSALGGVAGLLEAKRVGGPPAATAAAAAGGLRHASAAAVH